MRHEEQIRLGTATTLDEPVSETIVSYFFLFFLFLFYFVSYVMLNKLFQN